jgi:hypothetical protein
MTVELRWERIKGNREQTKQLAAGRYPWCSSWSPRSRKRCFLEWCGGWPSDLHLRRHMSGSCQVHAVSTRISTVRIHLSLSRARIWHPIRPVNTTEASPFRFIPASSSAGGPKKMTTPSSLGLTRRTVSRVHLSLADSKGGGNEGDADGELGFQQGAAFPSKRRPLENSRQTNLVP